MDSWTTRMTKTPEPFCAMCGNALEIEHDPCDLIIGGGVLTMGFGYGSCHDTDSVECFICDACAESFVKTLKVPPIFHSPIGAPWDGTIQGDGPKEFRERCIKEYGMVFVTDEELKTMETRDKNPLWRLVWWFTKTFRSLKWWING